MNIQEFHAELSSDKTRTPVFATLRKLMALDRVQLAAFQESGEDTIFGGEWAIWNGSNANNAACAATA